MEALDERIRVVRLKRVPAGVRAKRRRQQRKRRAKRKRWLRRYKRTRRFKRLKVMRKRLRKRISGLRKPRRRVFVSSLDAPAGSFLGEAHARLANLREQFDDMEDEEQVEPADAEEVEDVASDPELAAVAVADAYATIEQLADLLIQLLQDEAERNPSAAPEIQKTLDVLADLKDDADVVQSVIGYTEEDEEEEADEKEDDEEDDDDDEPESDDIGDDSAPPEAQSKPTTPGGEVGGVGWVRSRESRGGGGGGFGL